MNYQKRFYKLTDIPNLKYQVERLCTRKNVTVRKLMKDKGSCFYVTYARAIEAKKATSNLLRKLAKIGVYVEDIITKQDFDFIFGD